MPDQRRPVCLSVRSSRTAARPAHGALGIGLLVALLASACTAGAPDRPGEATRPPLPATSERGAPSSTAPAPGPSASPPGQTAPPPAPLTVALGGDVHAAGSSRSALSGGLAAITPVLTSADVAVVNLETAVTGRGTPADKGYTFRAPATLLTALKAAGVDAVGLGNNHGLDYGQQGLTDTLQAASDAGLRLLGAGLDEDAAYAPAIFDVRGRTVAVLDATQVLDTSVVAAWTAGPGRPGLATAIGPDRVDRLVAAVRQASQEAMSVVVLLHWGVEKRSCPTVDQEDLAARLVTAGADAVVGSHAHVLAGGGWTGPGGTAYVDYGLGNLVFYATSTAARESGVLELTLGGDDGAVQQARWVPAQIRGGVPVPLDGTAATRATERKAALRSCTDLAAVRGLPSAP